MAGNFLHNAWYCAALDDEITREPIARIILNESIVMYRKEDGTVVALENTCPHRRAPLNEGTLQGDNIQCPYHGIVFDCSGKAIWAQGKERIQNSMRVRPYPLVEKDSWLWIWMGDPALADETLIFDCFACVDPRFAAIRGVMPSKNAAMLNIDNLMDLSHTAFVHAGTVGSADDLDPQLSWERKENWIRGTRTAAHMQPSKTYLERGAGDYYLTQTKLMTFSPPYNVNVDIFTKEADCEPGKERFHEQFLTYNMITPQTDDTCLYFWAYCRDFRIDDPEFHEVNIKVVNELLTEDRLICESVQRMIDLNPDHVEVDLAADAGGLQARRILRRLIAEERSASSAVAAE